MAKKQVEKKPTTTKKKKGNLKKLLSAPQAMSMKAKPVKENPFETIWNRRKFDIVGKKRKGEERLIGSSRSKGIEQRKNTLLKEYKESGRSSAFLDKRIGERNDTLGEFDKAIMRFQREQQLKWKKKTKYNLSDGEEDDFEIQGGGSLSNLDDFDDEMLRDDMVDAIENNDKHGKSSTFLHDTHDTLKTVLSEGNENKHKTKKEVMEEIISKSKFYKARKAKEKEENDELMQELDKNFASLAQSEALLTLIRPTKMNALKALLNKSSSKESAKGGLSGPADRESSRQDQPDAYDKLVKEMVMDMRARPSGRTKTEEEIAQEERERLELLEEERQKRMIENDDSDGEGSEDDESFNEVSQKKLRPVSGDDLGDSFCLDEEPTKKVWVDEILERRKDDDLENGNGTSSEDLGSDDDDSGDSMDSESLKDWEQSDDDNLDTDREVEDTLEDEKGLGKVLEKEVNLTDQNDDPPNSHKINTGTELSLIQESLPFIIEAPKSLAEFCTLLGDRSDAEVIEAIARIRSCNAISLAAENRKKMQVFYGVLLQYFAVVANRKPLNFNMINLLVKPLMEMSSNTPIYAALCARERLLRIRNKLCDDIKNQEKSSWPSLKTLLLLRLWSMIFPCSDFRHPVMTPALMLMNECLMRCPITSGRDIAIGSFLCSMILSVTKESRKFCPEALYFIKTLLMSASENKSQLYQDSQCYFVMEMTALTPWLHLSDHVTDIHPLDFFMVVDMPADSPFFSSDNFRVGVLLSLSETLRGFVSIYDGFSSFPEIFLPISTLLYEVVKQKYIPRLLHGSITDLAQLIKRKADELQMLRLPLQMRKRKPLPIKQFNPKFEENYIKGRDYDPDRQRAELKKIKRQLKQEARGAVRNLRKDNYFLSEVKEKERLLAEQERAEKYGKARAFLQEQEHAFKSGQLGKGKKRRR